MEPIKQKFVSFLISYPKSMLISLLLLSILAIYPASRIQTNFNLEEFFPKEDETLLAYQKAAELFGRDDNTFIIAFRHKQLSDSVLIEIKAVQDRLKTHPFVSKVYSVWDLAYLQLENDAFSSVYPIQLPNPKSGLKEIHSRDLLNNTLLSVDETLSLMLVSIDQEHNMYSSRKEMISFIEQTVSDYSLNSSWFITGIPHFRTQYVDYLNREIGLYIGLGSILIISLLWLLYRNIRDVLLPILIVWLTILFTVAIMSLTGGFFEVMSSTIAPILLCVGIGDSVHMLTKYNDSIYLGTGRKESLIETIRTLGLATLLTSVTTAIGFATLLVSNVLPMKRFGLYTAIGVMVAFVATILFLPSFIYLFKRKHQLSYNDSWFDKTTDKLLLKIELLIRKKFKLITILGALIALSIGSGAFYLGINSKVFDDIGEHSDLIKQMKEVGEKLNPPIQLDVILDTKVPDGVFNPQIHEDLHKIEQHLKSFPEFKRIRSIDPILQQMHEELTGNTNSFFSNDSSSVANYLFLLELSSSEAFTSFIDFEYRTIRISINMDDIGSAKVNILRDQLEHYFQTQFPNREIYLSGSGILVADLAYNLVYSLNSSIYLALIFIGFFMYLLFKTPSLTIISILPNLFPLLITAGLMGWFSVALKPSTAVIFTITFGIAVDDTIHFLARYRLERKKAISDFEAVFITLRRTGKAIILTSLILLMGFGVLVTSTFDSTMLMGTLTCITIFTAVLYDLLFLPSLLTWKIKSETKSD
jgi:uncharacterized protein